MTYALTAAILAMYATLAYGAWRILARYEDVIETMQTNASIERAEHLELVKSSLEVVERMAAPVPAADDTEEKVRAWLSEHAEFAPTPTKDWTDDLIPDVPPAFTMTGGWEDEVVPGVPIEDPFDVPRLGDQ